MEFNKDEAVRAQIIAVNKFNAQDYEGARTFAVKAQALHPQLKNMAKLIGTIDVFISSKKITDGEVDWYKVLNLDPSADEDTIRKQYKKIALTLHPDKNKSVDDESANNAFKFITEANSVLSDRERRREYDERRRERRLKREKEERRRREQGEKLRREQEEQLRREQHNVSLNAQTTGYQSNGVYDFGFETTQAPNAAAQSQPGAFNAGGKTTAEPKAHSNRRNKATKRKATQPPQDTFWTTCNRCEFHYEFAMLYLNGKLLCPNCKKPFIAKKTSPPPGYSTCKIPAHKNQDPKNDDPNSGHTIKLFGQFISSQTN